MSPISEVRDQKSEIITPQVMSKVQRMLHPMTPEDWGLTVTLEEMLADPEGAREFSKYCPINCEGK
jgi:hypothetical protein